MYSSTSKQIRNNSIFGQKCDIPRMFLERYITVFLITIIIALSFISYKVQGDINSFQEKIQLLQKNVQESKHLNSLKDNESLTLEKDLAGLEKDRVELQSNSNAAVFQALGTLVIVLGFISTWRSQNFAEKNAAEAQKTANTVQITHRFTEAVNQLGNDKVATRLGGIYALQSIATESEDYFLTVTKILCGFVRDQSPKKSASDETNNIEKGVGIDIQSALDFIGQSNHLLWYNKENSSNKDDFQLQKNCFFDSYVDLMEECDSNKPNLDLSFTNLSKAKLANKCFAKVSFRDALLSSTDFLGSCLHKARFTNAMLKGVDFREADLRRASFKNADLTQAKFENANLEGVNFSDANLEGAVFCGAKAIDINGIKRAKNWQLAKFDSDICQQLEFKADL
jgi:hypothetical protein